MGLLLPVQYIGICYVKRLRYDIYTAGFARSKDMCTPDFWEYHVKWLQYMKICYVRHCSTTIYIKRLHCIVITFENIYLRLYALLSLWKKKKEKKKEKRMRKRWGGEGKRARGRQIFSKFSSTGWQRPIGCLKLQVIFRQRATVTGLFCRKLQGSFAVTGLLCSYRALLQKMT